VTNKRVLIITDAFPPEVGGGSTIRIAKFSKYLARLGWWVTVLTTGMKRADQGTDHDSVRELQNVNVIKIPVPFPVHPGSSAITGKKVNRRSLIRAVLAFPDGLIRWVPFVVTGVLTRSISHKNSVILATVPVFSSALAGALVKVITGCSLVIDVRDDWALNPAQSYDFSFRRTMDSLLEKCVYRVANIIVCTSDAIMRSIEKKHGLHLRNKLIVIPNGFDPEDFQEHKSEETNKFVLTYVGILNPTKTPQYLFQGVAGAISIHPEIRGLIRIRLVGVTAPWIRDLAEKSGIDDILELPGFVSHTKSVNYMLSSDVLVLILFREEGGASAVPGKLYEYFAAKRPILGLVCRGKTRDILEDSGTARICEPSDVHAIRDTILEFFNEWKSEMLNKISIRDGFLEQYNRTEQARVLSQNMEQLLT